MHTCIYKSSNSTGNNISNSSGGSSCSSSSNSKININVIFRIALETWF